MTDMPHVIVTGNEKGGTGKSTLALHVAVGLLHRGYRVGTLDLDARQATLTRYLDNRRSYAESHGAQLHMPPHFAVMPATHEELEDGQPDDMGRLELAMAHHIKAGCEILLMDTPGSDNPLSRAAHSLADTLVTPLNDSLIDLDVLARVDPDEMKVLGPSHYAEMVWDQRKRRAQRGGRPLDWVVLRNRLSHLDARNKRRMEDLVQQLAERIRFRLAGGVGERVIYRELFLKGLTLHDLREPGVREGGLTMSQVAAREELRGLVDALNLSPPAGAAAEADHGGQ